MTLASIVSPISSPEPPTGLAAPMAVSGAIAAACPARVSSVPAEPAMAPAGATYTTTGTGLLANSCETSLLINSVAAARSVERKHHNFGIALLGCLMPRSIISSQIGFKGPSRRTTTATGLPL